MTPKIPDERHNIGGILQTKTSCDLAFLLLCSNPKMSPQAQVLKLTTQQQPPVEIRKGDDIVRSPDAAGWAVGWWKKAEGELEGCSGPTSSFKLCLL